MLAEGADPARGERNRGSRSFGPVRAGVQRNRLRGLPPTAIHVETLRVSPNGASACKKLMRLRPPVELFDLAKDPDCVHHLANNEMNASKAIALRERPFAELKGTLAVFRIGREMGNPTTLPKSCQGRLSIAQRFIAGNGRAAGLSSAGTAEGDMSTGASGGYHRSAGFQPAVSRIFNPPAVRSPDGLPNGIRRYSRLEVCATGTPARCAE